MFSCIHLLPVRAVSILSQSGATISLRLLYETRCRGAALVAASINKENPIEGSVRSSQASLAPEAEKDARVGTRIVLWVLQVRQSG